jgi:hypothetical protein
MTSSAPRRSGLRLPWTHESDEEEGGDLGEHYAETVTDAEPTAAATADADAAAAADASTTAGASAVTPEGPKPDENMLVDSLVAAMRDVAERERASMLAGLQDRVDREVQALTLRTTESAEELRRRCDLDIEGIRDWVGQETNRLREEGDRKTERRREQLAQQLSEHEERGAHEVEALRARLSEYEQQLAAFFSELSRISDPATFGAAAKRMPRPPTLADVTKHGTGAAPAGSAEAARPVATTYAERLAALGVPEPAPDVAAAAPTSAGATAPEAGTVAVPAVTQEAPAPQAEPAPEAEPVPEAEPAQDAEAAAAAPDEVEQRLAELDAKLAGDQEATGAEGAAPEGTEVPGSQEPTAAEVASPVQEGDEVATAVTVKGLGSFGAITSFKQALERVEGVRGISLSLSPSGEFVYRATHDAGFDLAAAISTLEGGSAEVERADDGSIRVTVQRPR